MLLGQIIKIEESGFVRIVREYGKVNTLSPSGLYPCTATNVKVDFSTKIYILQQHAKKQVGYRR